MMISRPGIRFALTLVLAAAFYSTASMAMRDPLPFADVVAMSKRGDSPSSINAAMRSARTTYALRGSDFGKLAAIGMSPVVLDEIQQRFSDDVDLLTRYWVVGEFMGRCIPCYPQQVDLTGIDSGVAPKTFPPPLRAPFGKPLGLPDWFKTQHYRSNSITVEQVRQMSKAGKSDAEIIAALDAAVLQEAFGSRSGTKSISSNLVAGISGSQLADLRAEGMSDPVLDRLQVSWLGSYVEFLRIRYQSLGKGAQP